MLKTDIKGFQQSLKRKAKEEGISVEEYCNPNTDFIVLGGGKEDLPLCWVGKAFDFVVWGDEDEAREECVAQFGDKVVPLVEWLIRNGIITNEFHLS